MVSGGWCPGAPQAGGWLLPAAANGALPPGAGDGALAGRGDGGLALAPLEGEAAPRRLRPLAIGEAGLGGVALGESLVMDSMCRAKGRAPREANPQLRVGLVECRLSFWGAGREPREAKSRP